MRVWCLVWEVRSYSNATTLQNQEFHDIFDDVFMYQSELRWVQGTENEKKSQGFGTWGVSLPADALTKHWGSSEVPPQEKQSAPPGFRILNASPITLRLAF